MIKLSGIHFHPYSRLRAAADRHIAHPGNLQQFLRDDAVGRVVHLRTAHRIAGKAEDHNRRIGRIHFAIARIGRHRRQHTARSVNRCLYVACRAVNVAA